MMWESIYIYIFFALKQIKIQHFGTVHTGLGISSQGSCDPQLLVHNYMYVTLEVISLSQYQLSQMFCMYIYSYFIIITKKALHYVKEIK